jgi:ribosome-associated heat shock protein Hsp15
VTLAGEGLRLDKFLWFVRLAKTRSAAQALAATGHLRLDGRRVERAHACVRVGSVLSLPHGNGARVVRVEALPVRRGPAPEARACYEVVGESPGSPA